MQGIEAYAFVLSLIVFILLTGLSVVFIVTLIKMSIALIRLGHDDEDIKNEKKIKGSNCLFVFIEGAVSIVLCVLLLLVFAFSVYVNVSKERYIEGVPTIQVVSSSSMSKKHEKNTYLVENNLNDQLSTFDLVLTYKIPPAEEIEVFDIVVYERDGILVLHRVIGIDPPNAVHPDEYWFTCKGDALENIDRFPVRYDQLKGIYRGQRIPYAGSFISFMQSPAGVLCILLVLFGTVATPIAEKKLQKERDARYEIIMAEGDKPATVEIPAPAVASPFAHLSAKAPKTFRQKLRASKEIRTTFNEIKAYIESYEGVRQIESDKFETFKRGNTPIAKITVRGKTLSAYLALNPIEYADTKYIFTDVSEKASYKNYPMLVKLTSARQIRWTKELIDEIGKKQGLTKKGN